MSLAFDDIRDIIVYIQGNAKTLYELSREDLERVVVEFGGLTDPIGQLESWIAQQLQSVVSAISSSMQQIISPIVSAINSAISWIQTGFSNFTSSVSSILSSMQSAISSTMMSVYNALTSLSTTLQNALSDVQNAINNVSDSIKSAINSAVSSISSTMQNALSGVQSALSSMSSALQSMWLSISSTLPAISQAISSSFAAVQSTLSSAFSTIQSTLSQIASALSQMPSMLQSLASSVAGALSQIPSLVQSAVSTISSTVAQIPSMLQSFFADVRNSLTGLVSPISDAVSRLTNILSTVVLPNISSFASQVMQLLQGISQTVSTAVDTVRNALSNLPDYIRRVIDMISHLPDAVTRFTQGIEQAFGDVGKNLDELRRFVQQIIDTINSLPDLFKRIPELLATATYYSVKDFLDKLGLDKLVDSIKQVLSAINDWIGKLAKLNISDLVSGFVTAFQRAGDVILNGLKTIYDAISSFFMTLGAKLIDALKGAWSAISDTFVKLGDLVKGELEWFYSTYVKPALGAILNFFLNLTRMPVTLQAGQDPVTVYGPNILGMLLEIGGLSALTLLTLAGPAALLRGVGEAAGDQEVDMAPLGLGVRIKIRLGQLIAALARVFEEVPREIGRAVALAGLLAFLEPLRYISRYIFWMLFTASGLRSVPFELPSYGELHEIARRFDVYSMLNNVVTTYMFRGLPYWFISYIAAVPQKPYSSLPVNALDEYRTEMQQYYITVVDRFGNTRIWPLSPLFRLPTESDIVHFMLRDLFLPLTQNPADAPPLALKSFVKAMWAHGVPPDVAIYYYLRAFELPSPTQLWNFTARALAGMAWFKPPREIVDFAVAESKLLGAFEPKSPTEVNFDYHTVLMALAEYQKWHGRAHFAWLPGYTSDAWLIIDQEAHLADRADIAHMIRFGIYDYMSQRGVTMETTLKDTLIKVLDNAPTSPMQLDIAQASRFLVARGFHPYVAPYIAIRDLLDVTIAARTLLRTGLVNLIRENISTVSSLVKAMSGLFTISAKVAYFDLDQLRWVTAWFNTPIYYLAPERALIALRAIFDKAVLYMRNMTRTVLLGVRDNVIDVSTAISTLRSYTENVLDKYVATYARYVTGAEYHLTWDKDIEPALAELMSAERDIAAVRRIRYYTRYMLYRVLYMISRGLLKQQQISQYIDDIVAKMHEVPQVRELYMSLAQLIYAYSLRELVMRYVQHALARHAMLPDDAVQILQNAGIDQAYAQYFVRAYAIQLMPTVAQYAALANYVPSALERMDVVLALNRVPDDWRQYWQQYIYVRVYHAFAARIATALVALMSYVRPSVVVAYGDKQMGVQDIAKSAFAVLAKYGYDQTRQELLQLAANIRMSLASYRMSYPTPRQFLADARYLPDPASLYSALSSAWPITDAARAYYAQLLNIRAYYSYVMRALTAFLTFVANVPQTVQIRMAGQIMNFDQVVQSIQSLLSKYGVDSTRMNLINLTADLRRALTEYRHSFPTPRQFLADMMYVPDPDALYKSVSQYWVINDWGKQYIQSMIPYRRYRRWIFIIVDYITRAVGRGNMTPQDAMKVLQQLTRYGLSKYDLEIINYLILAMQCYYSGCVVQ